MALTIEQEAEAQVHASGALDVYKKMQASLKATEEDILKKIDAFKIAFANEVKRLDGQKETVSVVKNDPAGIALPEESPSPQDFFHKEKADLLSEGVVKLKEDDKAAKKEADENQRLTEEQLKRQQEEDFQKENKMSSDEAKKIRKDRK